MKHLEEWSVNRQRWTTLHQVMRPILWYQLGGSVIQFATHHSCLGPQSTVQVEDLALGDNTQTIPVGLASNRIESSQGMLRHLCHPNHCVQTIAQDGLDNHGPIVQTILLLQYRHQ